MRKRVNVAVFAAMGLACAFAPPAASGQSSSNGASPTGGTQATRTSAPDIPPSGAPQGRLWSFSAAASSVFESNIDRNQENNRSEGVVLGVGGLYRNRVDRPTFTAQYEVGGHMYAGAQRWDRISHHLRAAYERRLLKPLTFEAVGEMSIKGSTEDRELGNQYIVSPRLQFRLSREFRFGLESGYRVKHYADRARNAVNPYGGVRLTRRFGRGRWDLGYRYEENLADTERNRYIRSTYSGNLVVPFTLQDSIGVELKFRPRRYERLVRVGDNRVRLRDLKWTLSPEWVHALGPGLQFRASYEFEARDANDPGRTYNAHSMVIGVERRW